MNRKVYTKESGCITLTQPLSLFRSIVVYQTSSYKYILRSDPHLKVSYFAYFYF